MHERARQLIAAEAIEGLEATDRAWLEDHLETCAACAEHRRSVETAVGIARSSAVRVPPDLALRTQFRIGLRAQERRKHDRGWILWVSFGLSWATGVATAPLVWRGFEWFGHFAGLATIWLKFGFVLWWAVPAAVSAALVWSMEKTIEER